MAIEIQISNQLDDRRWDEFVAKNRLGQHEQTSGFAKTRRHAYDIFRILLLKEGVIMGGSQVLVLPTLTGKIAEIHHGPIFSEDNMALVGRFLDALKKEADKRNLAKIKVLSLGGNGFKEHALRQLGFLPTNYRSSLGLTTLVDLTSTEDEIFARMKKKTRYNIRFARRKGVSVKVGGRSDIESFYATYQTTSEQKGFPIFSIDYFYYLWDLFSKEGKIHLLVARENETPLATMILIPYGNRICSLWSSAVRVKPDNKAGYLLDWEAILMAKKMGFNEYDLCGTDPDSTSGHSEFKKSFGGIDYQYPDALELYFGILPKLKRQIVGLILDLKVPRKLAEKYFFKSPPRLPF